MNDLYIYPNSQYNCLIEKVRGQIFILTLDCTNKTYKNVILDLEKKEFFSFYFLESNLAYSVYFSG